MRRLQTCRYVRGGPGREQRVGRDGARFSLSPRARQRRRGSFSRFCPTAAGCWALNANGRSALPHGDLRRRFTAPSNIQLPRVTRLCALGGGIKACSSTLPPAGRDREHTQPSKVDQADVSPAKLTTLISLRLQARRRNSLFLSTSQPERRVGLPSVSRRP